jgi:hypothetical protein
MGLAGLASVEQVEKDVGSDLVDGAGILGGLRRSGHPVDPT